MRANLSYTNLKNKSERDLRRLLTKYREKQKRVNTIYRDANQFGIPLSQVSLNALSEKYEFYETQCQKIFTALFNKMNGFGFHEEDVEHWDRRYRTRKHIGEFKRYAK